MTMRTLLQISAVALFACSSVSAEQISTPRPPRNLYFDAIPEKFYRENGMWVFPHVNNPKLYSDPLQKKHDYSNAVECILFAHKMALSPGVSYSQITNAYLDDCKKRPGWPQNWPDTWPTN